MPFLNVKGIEGVFHAAREREVVKSLTEVLVSIEGEAMRPVTGCVLDEVHSGEWGIGSNAPTTAGVKNLAAGQPVAS